MTLTLELPPEVEGALAEEARREGTTPEQLVLKDLRRRYQVPEPRPDTMLELFAKWEAEDATDDPDELARRNQEWETTKAALESNRFSLEGRTDFRAILGDEAEDASEETGL